MATRILNRGTLSELHIKNIRRDGDGNIESFEAFDAIGNEIDVDFDEIAEQL